MIKVNRLAKPQILIQKADSWLENLMTADTKSEKKKAASKYRHTQIKGTLTAMFHGKCAYCESQILHIDYGHIEHFRPQSLFPHLTFEWENLLLACGKCNGQENKDNNFPEEADDGSLINPCDDDPAPHFDFVFDEQAQISSVYGKTSRGELTEKILNLNRPDLLRQRSKHVQRLVFIALKAAENDEKAIELIEEACQNSSEYTAFARMLKERFIRLTTTP